MMSTIRTSTRVQSESQSGAEMNVEFHIFEIFPFKN